MGIFGVFSTGYARYRVSRSAAYCLSASSPRRRGLRFISTPRPAVTRCAKGGALNDAGISGSTRPAFVGARPAKLRTAATLIALGTCHLAIDIAGAGVACIVACISAAPRTKELLVPMNPDGAVALRRSVLQHGNRSRRRSLGAAAGAADSLDSVFAVRRLAMLFDDLYSMIASRSRWGSPRRR